MFSKDKIDSCFPLTEWRDGQRECVEFIVDAFNSGKRIVIVEGPTGSGKSPIAMTLAEMVPRSYYLTITKVLQDQLRRDYQDLHEVKGRGSYPCTFYERFGEEMVRRRLWSRERLNELRDKYNDCGTGYCRTKESRSQQNADQFKCSRCFTRKGPNGSGKPSGDLTTLPLDMAYSACPYYEKIYAAVNNRKVLMNFSSFLFQTTMTKRFAKPRDLMIIDEGHNIEDQLLSFISFRITDSLLKKYNIFIPPLDTAKDYAMWFEEVGVGNILKLAIATAQAEDNPKLEEELGRLFKKYLLFTENVNKPDTEWIAEYEEKKGQTGNITHRAVIVRPVFVKNYAEQFLFKYASHILIMSATILDVNIMCDSLGIDRDIVAARRMKNRFPKENRPIYLDTRAKMVGGKSAMPKWIKPLCDGVNEIAGRYNDKRGIIHTHNFAILDGIVENCDQDVRSRLLIQRNFKTKHEMLVAHSKKHNSILIAPALHEGIDLRDDLSRFQIICKVPYANFFDDKQLTRRMELDDRYYDWITALKLVQSYGRSIRSVDDYADTFILDEAIHRFLIKARRMLPSWFLEAICQHPTPSK